MIVCMSRRICVELYDELVQAAARVARRRRRRTGRHEGRHDRLGVGPARSGSSTSATSPAREALAERFRDPTDPFRIVIVRDMWLTGFDAPCLHTMYVDKPMRGHGLMQAIARVNRVFRDKPGGLVVDYLGLADELQAGAGDLYRERRNRRRPPSTRPRRSPAMLEKYEICRGLFHGFDWSPLERQERPAARLALLPAAQEHILAQEDGKERFAAGRHRIVAGLCPRRAA